MSDGHIMGFRHYYWKGEPLHTSNDPALIKAIRERMEAAERRMLNDFQTALFTGSFEPPPPKTRKEKARDWIRAWKYRIFAPWYNAGDAWRVLWHGLPDYDD